MVHLSHSIATLIVLVHLCMDTVSPERRIFKGRRVKIAEFPFFVTINYGITICGGSIISPLWIATAQHCFILGTGWKPAYYINVPLFMNESVLAGNELLNISKTFPMFPGATERRIKIIFLHPKYDVALVRLKEPVDFNETIQRILLPRRGEGYKFTTIYTLGFGATEESTLGSDFLKASQHNFQESDQCFEDFYNLYHNLYPNQKYISNLRANYNPEFMICAPRKGGQGVCKGDSGGPLVARRAAGSPVLSGITSAISPAKSKSGKWEACSDLDSYSFFMRTSFFLDWIYSIAGENLSN